MLVCLFLSQEEPKKVSQALADAKWLKRMHEETVHIKLQEVWVLCDLPEGKRVIGTKWVFRNKRDERGTIIKNKARLVAQGYRQEEGVDYDEFCIGYITEEGYVKQPPGFEDPAHPNKVYRVVKALYGLHQAPRAWYERLSTFLLKHGYRRGAIDKTSFNKKDRRDIMLKEKKVKDVDVLLYKSMIGESQLLNLLSDQTHVCCLFCVQDFKSLQRFLISLLSTDLVVTMLGDNYVRDHFKRMSISWQKTSSAHAKKTNNVDYISSEANCSQLKLLCQRFDDLKRSFAKLKGCRCTYLSWTSFCVESTANPTQSTACLRKSATNKKFNFSLLISNWDARAYFQMCYTFSMYPMVRAIVFFEMQLEGDYTLDYIYVRSSHNNGNGGKDESTSLI
ncbi:putative ribonuclease H-like domain-containing protein [Tanacetum coccineum]